MSLYRSVATLLAVLAFFPVCGSEQARPLFAPEELRNRFLALTDGWAQQAVFNPAEQEAMDKGRRWEQLMTAGLDDPLAQKILEHGEPSYRTVSSFYPSKVLDRTVLGSYSDPHGALDECQDEFMVWWNGAISAHLLRGQIGGRTQTVAENTNVLFRAGAASQMLGTDQRYSRIGYEEGYLPILQLSYESGGIRYLETALADRRARPAGCDVAYVRLQIINLTHSPNTGWLGADVTLIDGTPVRAEGQQLLDSSGSVLMSFSDSHAEFDAERHRLVSKFRLAPRTSTSVYFKIPYQPAARPLAQPPTAADFEQAHRAVRDFWQRLLASGMSIEVPEKRVNDVWRALLLQEFVLADGPRFTYGSGLVYNDSYFPFEDGFATLTLARYGFPDYANALLAYSVPPSVEPQKAGWRYQNRRAIPFHLIYEDYRLTRRVDVFQQYRDSLFKVAEEIIHDRHSTMTPDEGSKPLHWGLLPPARPGVDAVASTRANYVPAHDITNCQGLQDFGEFLVESGVDRQRGQRYIDEARDFRAVLLNALERSAIRVPGRPSFAPLDTLYFRQTPDYGPEPYSNLALGRVQGTYYHYWADMEFDYDFFNPDDPVGQWIADYIQERGGFVLGCTRARSKSGQAYGWINNNYNAGYYNYRLRAGQLDRFLLGFYSRLAFGMSRNFYVASEGSPFIGYNTQLGGFVSARYSFPNSAANSETLGMLRNMLVMEELKNNVATGEIDLARGVPRAWLADGKQIRVRSVPTFYGPLSFVIRSAVSRGVISAWVTPPGRDRFRHLVLNLRHPQNAPIRRVLLNGRPYRNFDAKQGAIRLPYGSHVFRVRAYYR